MGEKGTHMKQQKIREELKECQSLMADLFQSGLAVVPKPMTERLNKESTIIRQYGMTTLADMLSKLGGQLEKRRHAVSTGQEESLCELFVKIDQYLDLAISQADLDEAGERIRQKPHLDNA